MQLGISHLNFRSISAAVLLFRFFGGPAGGPFGSPFPSPEAEPPVLMRSEASPLPFFLLTLLTGEGTPGVLGMTLIGKLKAPAGAQGMPLVPTNSGFTAMDGITPLVPLGSIPAEVTEDRFWRELDGTGIEEVMPDRDAGAAGALARIGWNLRPFVAALVGDPGRAAQLEGEEGEADVEGVNAREAEGAAVVAPVVEFGVGAGLADELGRVGTVPLAPEGG